MAHEFIIKNGFVSKGNSLVEGILSGQTFNIINTPVNNNSATEVLVRNSITGVVEYRDSSSLSGGTSTTDVFVNSGTADVTTQQLTFTNTTGGTFNVTNAAALFSDNDINVTGGTYNPNDGCVTFTTNSGSTFDICGFVSGLTNTFTTGGTYDSTTELITFTNTTGGTYTVDLSTIPSAGYWDIENGGLKSVNLNSGSITGTSIGAVLVGGWPFSPNLISDGDASTIINGSSNIISGASTSSIVSSQASEILAKSSAPVDEIRRSSIFGGDTNKIEDTPSGSLKSSMGVIVGGGFNNINDSFISSIFGSTSSTVSGGGYGTILGGINNEINTDPNALLYSSIIAGFGNRIQDTTSSSPRSTIIGGNTNEMSDSRDSTILGGNDNILNSVIAGTIIGSSDSTLSGGTNNIILGGSDLNIIEKNGGSLIDSSLIGGDNNTIQDTTGNSPRSTIIGGRLNTMANARDSVLLGSTSSEISNTCTNVGIINGSNNSIFNSTSSTIIGGSIQTMSGGSESVMIGGNNNKLLNARRSVILGGRNITGTTDATVYVPNLNIGVIGSGTSIYNLGLDANGFVVTGTTSSGGGGNSGITGYTYDPTENEFAIGISGSTPQTAIIDEMNGLTINGELTVTGDTQLDGDLIVEGLTTLRGQTTIGNSFADSVDIVARVNADIVPVFDDNVSLGDDQRFWKELYVHNITGGTLNLFSGLTTNNSGTEILVRNSTTGQIEKRDVSTIIGGTSGDKLTGYTYNETNNTFNIGISGSTPLDATINVVSGLTVTNDLIVSGNTGMGTDNPLEKLDVRGDILVNNPFNDSVLTISATSINDSMIDFDNAGVSTPYARIEGNTFGGGVSGNLQFYTYPSGGPLSKVMVLTNNQRVGIGNILNNDVEKTLHVMGDFKMEETNANFESDLNLSSGANVRLSARTTDQLPRISVSSPGDGGIAIGARGSTESGFPGYGANGDGYLYSSIVQNGLNIISAPSGGAGLPDYIRMYAGQDASGGVPDIHIQGRATADSVRGYVGIHTDTPTETLHVDGTVRIVDGTEQLGYVLTCDATGVASWQPSSGGTGTGYWEIENGGLKSINQNAGTISGTSTGSILVGGSSNTNNITDGIASTIINGGSNTISGARTSTIISTNSSIISGNSLSILQNSAVVGGLSNEIYGSSIHTLIGGGTQNKIIDSPNSSIIGGTGNYMDNATRSVILGGSNITGDTSDTVYVPQLNIRDVLDNEPVGTLGYDANGFVVDSNVSDITGGTLNGDVLTLINNNGNNITISGFSSGSTSGYWEEVADGNNALQDIKGSHTITGSSDNALIAGGSFNEIDDGTASTIIGGSNNEIVNSGQAGIYSSQSSISNKSTRSVIIGGGVNDLDAAAQSVIVGGLNNMLASTVNSVVLGGSNITGETSNTVYVPNLNVGVTDIDSSTKFHVSRSKLPTLPTFGGDNVAVFESDNETEIAIVGSSERNVSIKMGDKNGLPGQIFYSNANDQFQFKASGTSVFSLTSSEVINQKKVKLQEFGSGSAVYNLQVSQVGTGYEIITGNTGSNSGSCISELWVTNLESCSPLNINTYNQGNIYMGTQGGLPLVTVDITTPDEPGILFGEESFIKYNETQKKLKIGAESADGAKVVLESDSVEVLEIASDKTKLITGDFEAEDGNLIIKSGNSKSLIVEDIPDVSGANLGTDLDGKIIDLPSDSRCKFNIAELSDVVDPILFLDALKGYQFEFHPRTRISATGKKHYGFKVDDFRNDFYDSLSQLTQEQQDVNQIAKTFVRRCKTQFDIDGSGNKSTVDSMNYVDLIPFMVEGIKQLNTNINNITGGGKKYVETKSLTTGQNTITHSLKDENVIVQVVEVSTGQIIIPDHISNYQNNSVDIYVEEGGEYKIIIIG